MSKVKTSTVKGLAEAGLNGNAEIELLPSGVKFNIRAIADPAWLKSAGYNHVDYVYATQADYDKHRKVTGRSWNGVSAILRFNGRAFAVAVHSFNHSLQVASGYKVVDYTVVRNGDKRANGTTFREEKDKNGNWIPGHHQCLWCGDTYRLRGNRTTNYDITMRNAVIQAENLSGATASTPSTATVDVNYTVTVTGNKVNIRAGAGTNNAIVGVATTHQSFCIVKESHGTGANLWGLISGDSLNGRWIALDFTTVAVKESLTTYTVKEGDTLSVIARDNGVSLAELAAINGIVDYDKIRAGFALKMPSAATLSAPSATNTEETIWHYLKDKGFNDFATAGIVGNMYAESGLIPNNLQNSYEKPLGYTDTTYTAAVDNGTYTREQFIKDGAGYGLCQWTFHTRKAGLYDYWKSLTFKKSISDLTTQLDYFYKEILTYTAVMNTLRTATTVRESSDIIMVQFLRPADQSDTAKARRVSCGQGYYNRLASK